MVEIQQNNVCNHVWTKNRDGLSVCRNCGLVDEYTFDYNLFSFVKSDFRKPGAINTPIIPKPVDSILTEKSIFYYTNHRRYICTNSDSVNYEIRKHKAMNILKKILSDLDLSFDVSLQIGYMFRTTLKEEHCRKTIKIAAACVYCVILRNNLPISLKEVVDAFSKNGHNINLKNLKKQIASLNLGSNLDEIERVKIYFEKYYDSIFTAAETEERFNLKCKNIKIDYAQYRVNIYSISQKLIENYYSKNNSALNPRNMSVASIYAADRIHSFMKHHPKVLTIDLISNAVGIKNTSIRDLFNSYFKQKIDKRFRPEVRK